MRIRLFSLKGPQFHAGAIWHVCEHSEWPNTWPAPNELRHTFGYAYTSDDVHVVKVRSSKGDFDVEQCKTNASVELGAPPRQSFALVAVVCFNKAALLLRRLEGGKTVSASSGKAVQQCRCSVSSGRQSRIPMNIVRKLGSSRPSSEPAASASDDAESASLGDHVLALMHLRKVFNDLMRNSKSPEERDLKMYPVVKLFVKVSQSFTVEDIVNRFKEAAQFASVISSMLVQEIRTRAGFPSTIDAAVEIITYLKPSAAAADAKTFGWSILCALALLVSPNRADIVEAVCKAALPSTLVKTLYLFCDLPDSCPLDAMEVRLLRDVLMKVMVPVMRSQKGIEQLASKDDLVLIFCSVSSWCPIHNHIWRSCSSELLMTLSSRVKSSPLVNYVHDHKCVQLFVDNLRHAPQESLVDLVDMVSCLLCVLKDFASVSSILLEDFKSAGGYEYLCDLILQRSSTTVQNEQDALRNLLFVVNSMVLAGNGEIKAPETYTAWKGQNNSPVPQSMGEGRIVRNMDAFEVLETVFILSNQTTICCTVLDVLYSIFSADPMNYFLLETRCPIGKFVETVNAKSLKTQRKLFDLIEYIVFQLNYLPSKEFIAIAPILKMNKDMNSIHLIVRSLHKILNHSVAVKDIFRDVGLLDVLVTVLQNAYAAVRNNNDDHESTWECFSLVISTLCLLVKQCNGNVVVLREIGGTKTVFSMIEDDRCRSGALQLLQQVVMNPSGEDELAGVLALLHSTPTAKLPTKCEVLQFLANLLRESHRVRMAFRRVGGYVYLLSIVLSLGGAFKEIPDKQWVDVSKKDLYVYLRNLLRVLTMSMRFEPSNAAFFQNEVKYRSLAESIHLLGCFGEKKTFALIPIEPEVLDINAELLRTFTNVFNICMEDDFSFSDVGLTGESVSVCFVYRLLYDMAFDRFDRCGPVIEFKFDQSGAGTSVHRFLSAQEQNPYIVHSGAVMCICDLLAYVRVPKKLEMLNLQLFLIEILRSTLRSERNQQVMCDAGLPRLLFDNFSSAFLLEEHPLLPPLYYILERLAAQGVAPNEFRQYMRLDEPWCCVDIDMDEPSRGGNSMSLNRVKTLVSMTTPKDLRLSWLNASPPFVEFDMSIEGFGCIFLPSIAPAGSTAALTGSSSPLAHSASQDVAKGGPLSGGLGIGERLFPPASGLTFMCWLYVERFSEAGADAHPLRLLTIYRSFQGTAQSQRSLESITTTTDLASVQIQISPADRNLLIATYETDTPGADLDRDVGSKEAFARISIDELRRDRQWNHVTVVFSRWMLKSSAVSVFINGVLHSTHRINYLCQCPTLSNTGLPPLTAVNAVIGTIPGPFRKQSSLLWRLGTTYLIEEALSANQVAQVFELGPHYAGSFQAPLSWSEKRLPNLVAEEKVSFGLHTTAVSTMTLARLRKIYNKVDSRAIGKLLGIPSHENITPVRVMHNSAVHLGGPARSIGGVIVGYLGMRTFYPRPVSKLFETVGGVACILGLISMAEDTETLYAAVKTLFCSLKTNQALSNEMEKLRGFQILSVLLKEKIKLLNGHILYLLFSMVGTLDVTRETVLIPNVQTFGDLLCDLCVWNQASVDLQRLLYEHFYQLITEAGSQEANLAAVRQMDILCRLLYSLFFRPDLLKATKDILFNLIAAILHPIADDASVLKFGQFLVATISPKESCFNERDLPASMKELQEVIFAPNVSFDNGLARVAYNVYIRTRCLNVLLNMLSNTGGKLNYQLCEQLSRVLGFDWVLSLVGPTSHRETVRVVLQILLAMTRHSTLMTKFREGSGNGGWLTDAESVVQNRAGFVLGFSVSARSGSVGAACDLNPEVGHVPGFVALQHLLPYHANLPETHFVLVALLVGHAVKCLPTIDTLTLDKIWSLVLNNPKEHTWASITNKAQLCPEASLPILSVARYCLIANTKADWSQESPIALLQFLLFLYQNSAEFSAYAVGADFVSALASVLLVDDETWKHIRSSDLCNHRGLPKHNAVKYILDFLATICVDSFLSGQSAKGESVVDAVFTVVQNVAETSDVKPFVTAFDIAVMDRIEATDILARGTNAPLAAPSSPSSSYCSLAANVFYFASKLVDCLWNDMLSCEPQEVLDFLLKLFSQVKRKSGPSVPLDALYESLNRCLLFLMSRVTDTMKVQRSMIDCLQKVTSHRSLVFSPANSAPDFVGCMVHLLFILTDKNSFKLRPQLSNSEENLEDERSKEALEDGFSVLANTAKRVWEELFLSKKQILEETLSVPVVPEVNAMRAVAAEAASQHWLTFIDNEMKGFGGKESSQIHAQLQSKLHMVAGGLQRLASSKKTIRHVNTTKNATILPKTLMIWLQVHISLVYQLFELRHTRYLQWHQHTEKWCLEEWAQLKQDLTRQRGLWGPRHPSRLDKYMLDSTEGPCRMRKKLIPNTMFFVYYPYRPNSLVSENRSFKNKLAYSHDSKLYYERVKRLHSGCFDPRTVDLSQPVYVKPEQITTFVDDVVEMDPKMLQSSLRRPSSHESRSLDDSTDLVDEPSDQALGLNNLDSAVGDDGSIAKLGVDQKEQKQTTDLSPRMEFTKEPDNQTLLRLLEEGEELNAMYRCARVNGLDSTEGLLLFGKCHYYLVDGFTLLKSREIRDLDFLPEELHDPIVPYVTNGSPRSRSQKRQCSKFSYEDIRECHKRRYLLQPSAIEVFSSDGRNYLLAFPKKTRDKVYAKFLACAKSMTDVGHQSVSGQKSWVDVEQGAGFFSLLTGESSVTQRWVRGEISNFQYLMHLNTLAGRSYNDLSQYPVFPWILRDYDSQQLDLSKPSTFRDLGKPMGAQTEERLGQFLKRYREWDDPTGETPPYMYGTHYSSAMIVLSYLVRLEPFTQQFLKLQGGHFDLADRMFHCVKDAWISASRNNMADVKELIPEFFYLPDFLVNTNHFELGTKQSGVHLDDVVLPPWAKGDPREFVRLHREALESDYVSSRLHEWIDLIFGYRQQGQAAVESHNVFHHLFYEANVNFDVIHDPLTKNATLGFINNFGQIPSQLFKKPHPMKRLRLGSSAVLFSDPVAGVSCAPTDRLLFYHFCDSLEPPLHPVRELKQAVGQIAQNAKGALFAVEQNKVLIPSQYQRYLSWGFPDNSIRLGYCDSDKSVCIYESPYWGDVICACCPNSRTVVTGSTCTVVCVWEIVGSFGRNAAASLQLRKRLYGHTEPVSCISTSGSYGIIVSGSRDRTCIVWDLSNLSFIRQLEPHPGPVSAVCINEATGDIASASGSHLYLWSLSGEKLASVSTVSSSRMGTNEIIMCIAFSSLNEWDAQNVVITGTNSGIVKMWSLAYLLCRRGSHDYGTAPPRLGIYRSVSSSFVDSSSLVVQSPKILSIGSRGEEPFECISSGETSINFAVGNSSSSDEDLGLGSSSTMQRQAAEGAFDSIQCSDEANCHRTCSQMPLRRIKSEAYLPSSLGEMAPKWERRLVFRARLSMHTAFERKDNPCPAAVTALFPSRDHKILYVGDGCGRIWAWRTITDRHGGRADHWVQDLSRSICSDCRQKFTLTERRHHCRNCGQLFCSRCTRFESEVKHLKIKKPVRVCQNCYVRLKAAEDLVFPRHSTPAHS
uniref:WD repeat and FYVE domain-containing protein 3 n=1 Tax=Trichuris muris TaxID=70415 RepID=A0A5S6QX43_TRIMR